MDSRKTPSGISIRGSSIQISFALNGLQCRELIRCGRTPTKTQIKEADRKRSAILYEISSGTFDYLLHFPSSKSSAARKFRRNGHSITVEKAILDWFRRVEPRCAHATVRDYLSAINHHLIPSFGHYKLDDLKPGDIKDWIAKLQKRISNKRINNVLIPLRRAYKEAVEDEIIEKNPLTFVRNLPNQPNDPNPFNQKEIDQILAQLDGQARNLIQFAFYSGLRTSELIALEWQDIDFEQSRIYIRRAIVREKEKSTKTFAGLRQIDLHPKALSAIKDQRQYTEQSGEFVFHDPRSDARWKNDQAIRKIFWTPALKKAGVEYRYPYQTRHTYASMMLMAGHDPMYVARQMGHKDWGMIRKTYGRWIPSRLQNPTPSRQNN